jgi:hypothetical protein
MARDVKYRSIEINNYNAFVKETEQKIKTEIEKKRRKIYRTFQQFLQKIKKNFISIKLIH